MKARVNVLNGRSLKKFLFSMSVLLFFTSNYLAGQIKFDPANLDKSEKTIKSLINAKIDDLKKQNVKKIIISGCKGDFVLSRETAPDAFVNPDMTHYEIEKNTRSEFSKMLDQIYCVKITTRLLDSVISLFNHAGIEVVPVETWQQHKVYQEMLKLMIEADVDENKRYAVLVKTTTATRTLSVPAIDYRLEPEKLIKMMQYEKLRTQDKGKMLEDYGAQAFCNIAFSIDGLMGKPNLTGLTLFFETGMKKYDMGTKDKDGNKVYMYSITSNPILNIKGAMEYNTKTLSESKRIDAKKYDQAILEMQSYILSLFQDKLISALNDQ